MERAAKGEGWSEDEVSDFLDEISTAGEDYRRLVERLPAIVYSCEAGPRGRWRFVSPQIEDILGYSPEEWMADPGLWVRQLHPDDRERALAQERAGVAGDGDAPIDYRMITRSGSTVWILDEAVLEPDADGAQIWHGVLYDITERKLAEGELRRGAAQQAVVARLGRQALHDGDPERLRQEAVAVLTEIEGVGAACVWEAGDEAGLRLCAGAATAGGNVASGALARAESHVGAAYGSGLHVIVDEWLTERRYEIPAQLLELGVRGSLAVPIAGSERVLGVLDIHSAEPSSFTPQDVHFAQAVANVLADAQERHAAEKALRHRVLHDPLTGLPNRLSFVDSLRDSLRRAQLAATPVCVLFLDLDHFKLINDSIGHHAGDELLRAVAPRLRAHLRPGDVVARFGGDEFGVFVDRLADEEEAVTIAERVMGAFADPYLVAGAEHFVTASIGIAVVRPSASEPGDPDLLIRDADAAMYRAKEHGRGRHELFDAEMRARARRRLELERELRYALEREELELRYQPIVSLNRCEIVAAEALVRWRHPRRGLLEPAEFVSIAEEGGMIDSIGRWVQETACRQLVAWHGMRPDRRPLDIAVNLSAREVARRDLADSVAESLARIRLDPANLWLEITESALVDESTGAAKTLAALSELGVRLVLDDFGTGYSSLAYLHRYPFDALKIDRSFVDGLGVEGESTAIVEAVLGMARALGLDAIAEGVEDERQVAELRRLGCEYAQGNLFARPLEVGRVGELLRDGGFELLGDRAR